MLVEGVMTCAARLSSAAAEAERIEATPTRREFF